MSAVTKNKNYSVIKLSGQSSAGGDPDAIANKIMANWHLDSSNGDPSNLFKAAVPSGQFKSWLMLKTWTEGDVSRGSLFINDGSDPVNLDRGKVLTETKLNHGSENFEVVMEGNYLFRIRMECKPIADTDPPSKVDTVRSQVGVGTKVIGEILSVPVRLVRPMKGQPRKYFDPEQLREFGENLKEQGQIQPAIVKRLEHPDEKGCLYELISGERRWRASQMAGIPDLKIIVREGINDVDQFVEAVIANCHDVDLTTLETMQSVGYLFQCGKTDAEIGKIFGKKSPLWAYQHRRALTLHPGVLKLLGPETQEEKRIPLTSAILLIGIPQEEQMGFAEMISETGMSAKQVNHLVKNRLAQCGVARKSRSSEEFESALKFFMRTNAELELYIDHSDGRIANMFKNRSPEQISTFLRLVKDCNDNLGVVLAAFKEETQKSQP
ncbi:MAG: ParB/RepB/Spo0J family partition protein [Patescibacteria group bacterium]